MKCSVLQVLRKFVYMGKLDRKVLIRIFVRVLLFFCSKI